MIPVVDEVGHIDVAGDLAASEREPLVVALVDCALSGGERAQPNARIEA